MVRNSGVGVCSRLIFVNPGCMRGTGGSTGAETLDFSKGTVMAERLLDLTAAALYASVG